MSEDGLDELDKKQREFTAVYELCPPTIRLASFKASIAKAVLDFPTTRGLVDAVGHRPTLRCLCDWEQDKNTPSALRATSYI